MAMNRTMFPVRAPSREVITIGGRVAIGGTGAVGAQTGTGFTVTRTGVGLYTITFDSNGALPAILACMVDVVFATGGNTQSAYVLTLDATNKKVTLQTNDSGTPDVAADPPSGSFLQFIAHIQNTGTTG